MKNKIIKKEFNDIGEKITVEIQLKYDDLEISDFPESCQHCPVGFMKHDCGREIPLTYNGRPKTCRLRRVSTPYEDMKERKGTVREIIEYIKTLPMGFTENGKGGYNRRFYISDEKLREFAKQHGVEVKE